MTIALDREIRRIVDKAVRKARIVAEDGARKALTELGVEEARKPDGLSREKADLRNRLRTHAQSLGDVKAPNDSIRANRLVREIAYEHWHRALFARFLAENNLLIDPDHRVPVSLSDLEQIAKEEGHDLVELAADWAEPMLPQIFRKNDPVLALVLPPETKAGITEIVKSLPRPVFAADDSLGWVYQFWQADQKDRVNDSGVKIGADELPAVTQLFTEDYMVLFLLENTLGAWWAGKVLAADPLLASGAESEEELREKTSPPGYRWTYLRFMREPREGEAHETAIGPWRPAAGAFEGWPKAAKDITVLDPCMGSGHFLVFALPILVAFRRAEERIDECIALKTVLAENLFGLEIDPRCTQIAAFALALSTWKRLGGPEPLPKLNLACSGLTISVTKGDWLRLAERLAAASPVPPKRDLLGAEENLFSARFKNGLERIYDLFVKAPWLGSLIDPDRASGDVFAADFGQLESMLSGVLAAGASDEMNEMAVVAQGTAKATEILAGHYTLVATNVPYLGRGNQGSVLRDYCERFHPDAKNDLSTCFLERCLNFCIDQGSVSLVTSQNWFSQPRYEKLRSRLLKNNRWNGVARLGAGAFETIGGEVVTVSLVLLSNTYPSPECQFMGLDVSEESMAATKAIGLLRKYASEVSQASQLRNPDAIITLDSAGGKKLLSQLARAWQGLVTGDDNRFYGAFWERPQLDGNVWSPIQQAPQITLPFTGRETVVRWDNANGDLHLRSKAHNFPPTSTIGRAGIAIQRMVSLNVTMFSGDVFDDSVAPLIPENSRLLPAIYAFCLSDEFKDAVRRINHQPKVVPGALSKVPFDIDRWEKVARVKYPRGLPKPHSNDPTQWLFDGHPRGSADPNVARDSATNPRLVAPHGVRSGMAEHPLQVAVARLLGYRWPRQTGSSFMDCPALAEPDEVDRSVLVDADGIVPLPALAGEADAATRLRELIHAVCGPDYSEGTIREMLVAEETKAIDLAAWLADEFFDGHCRLFHQTPFIWHVWDGVRGGFSALVNYHRLCAGNSAGRRLLEKLRDSYLGEWIAAKRRALAAGEAGAEERLIAAEHLRGELTKIIEGEPPYDIFVRWKPLYRQSIGWEPDIDDSVRLNIRPFLTAKPKNSGRKDGCILRVTPRVKKHEGADRGAEPHREKGNFPWFWADDSDVETENFAGGPSFKGRRYNDFHYTRAYKQRARDAKANAARGVA